MQFAVEVRTSQVFKRASPIASEELHAAMAEGVNELRNEIVPRVPVNQGILRQGVQAQISPMTDVEMVGRVFDPVAYAVPVEAGTTPHFPPPGPLQLWVRRKLGITDERRARSVAFLIGRAISQRGTKARNFFRDGAAAARDRIRARFAEIPVRVVRRLEGGA